MNIESLLTPQMATQPEYFSPVEITSSTVRKYYEAVLKAYDAIGVNPVHPSRLCPGLEEDGYAFQASALMTQQCVRLGAHYVIANLDKTHVHEVDIFAFNGLLESTAGRLKSPDEKYIRDYTATDRGIDMVTEFILEKCAEDKFEPIEEARILALPQ